MQVHTSQLIFTCLSVMARLFRLSSFQYLPSQKLRRLKFYLHTPRFTLITRIFAKMLKGQKHKSDLTVPNTKKFISRDAPAHAPLQ
jgi:hypothetical protein